MSEILDKLLDEYADQCANFGRMETECWHSADVRASQYSRMMAARDDLVAHIRQQEAELATLRDQIKRAEDQEPVGVVAHMHELNDVWLASLTIGTKLYTHPTPSAPAVPDGFESVQLKSGPYGWRYAVESAVDLLRAIERNGQLSQGGEQYPNALNCIESMQRLSVMLAAAPSPTEENPHD